MMSNLLIFLSGWIASVIIFIVLKTRHNKVKTAIADCNERVADVTEENKTDDHEGEWYLVPTDFTGLPSEYVPDTYYKSCVEIDKEYEAVRREGVPESVKTYWLYRNSSWPYGRHLRHLVYVKRNDWSNYLKTLVKLEDESLNYSCFSFLKNPIYYQGSVYVEKGQYDLYKNLITNPIEPESLSTTEKGVQTWFFKIGGQYFDSDTPSYWLFLYRKFGYLNKDKLEVVNE
jgi:hypothetical protein